MNPLSFIWNKALKPMLDMCVGPDIIAQKQDELEAAERGEIVDTETGEVTTVKPDSVEGRANIKSCQDSLRAHERNLEKTYDLVENDPSSSDLG